MKKKKKKEKKLYPCIDCGRGCGSWEPDYRQ